MRIGIDVRLWKETGVGRYIRNLVLQLLEIDEKNEYVLFASPSDVADIKYQLANSKKNWKIVSTDIHWHTIREQIVFPFLLYKEKLDVMHFPYFSMPLLYRKPYIITLHDLILHHFPTGKASTLPLPVYYLKHFAYTLLTRVTTRNAKNIIVPLNAVKKDLIQSLSVNKRKISVTYEGVDDNIKNTNNIQYMKDKKYFLYVGNAYPHKNVTSLIDAFIKFKENPVTKEYMLILVGKEDFFYNKLSRRLKQLGIHSIQVQHNISDHFLSELYAGAVAVVAPSFMEGFGLVPLEAMANNTLVVASDIPAHREVCEDAAMYFDPHRVEDLQYALANAMNMEKAKREKFIRAGKHRQKKFSWEKMAAQTLKIYESSLSVSAR